MFKLPRSSWADYDAKLLSPGGGVYARSAKSIAITPQVQAGAGNLRRGAHADRARQRDPEGAGRFDLQRRHRNVRQGLAEKRTPRSATAPTMRCGSTAASFAAGHSSRAATSAAPSSDGSNTRSRAAASTPTPSTTRPEWIPPITRSTSRSCSGLPIRGRRTDREATQCPARGDDRRRSRARPARQRLPDAVAVGDWAHRAAAARRAPALHPLPGKVRTAQPRA